MQQDEYALRPLLGPYDPIVEFAARDFTKDVEKCLQTRNIEPSVCHRCLLLACQFGHAEIVRIFLQDGRADPSAENNRAIMLAMCNGNPKKTEMLLTVQMLQQDKKDVVILGHHGSGSIHEDIADKLICNAKYTKIVYMLLRDDRVLNAMDRENLAFLKARVPSVKKRMKNCHDTAMTFIAVYKYRQSVLTKTPRDVIIMLAKSIWRTWRDDAWAVLSNF